MIHPVHDAAQMNDSSEVLSQCLQALETNEATPENCTTQFPNNPELPVLLHSLMLVQQIPRPLLPAANKTVMRQQMMAAYRSYWAMNKPIPRVARRPIPRWLPFIGTSGILAGILAFLFSSFTTPIQPLATSTNDAFYAVTMTLPLSPTTPTRTPTATVTLTETGTPTATLPAVSAATATLRLTMINEPTLVPTNDPNTQPPVKPTKRSVPSKTSPTPGVGNNNSNANGGQGKDSNPGGGQGKDKK